MVIMLRGVQADTQHNYDKQFETYKDLKSFRIYQFDLIDNEALIGCGPLSHVLS